MDSYPQTLQCRTCVAVSGQSHLSWDSQSRELLLFVPELEELASSVLAVETTAAKERPNLHEERAGAPPASGKKK